MTPRKRTPKDLELWNWAFENFAGNGRLGLAIKKYLNEFEKLHGNRDGFIERSKPSGLMDFKMLEF